MIFTLGTSGDFTVHLKPRKAFFFFLIIIYLVHLKKKKEKCLHFVKVETRVNDFPNSI